MIETQYIKANGLNQHFRIRKGGDAVLVFIHGNGSDSVFWEELINAVPESFTCIAPDLRGYGKTEAVAADAERSFGDYVDDLTALLEVLDVQDYQLVGHSLGGGMAWEMLVRNFRQINSVFLINPASPYGFGGTKDLEGSLTFPDGAGSGAGVVNPDFVRLLEAKDRGADDPSSPLNVMNAFYWKPPFVPKQIDDLLAGLLRMQTGDRFYPGDFSESENFPFTAPGNYGQLNAASPIAKSDIREQLTELPIKPPIAWLRGGVDQIVSDRSMFDTAVHGSLGLIPGYPGEDICPPQPMVGQTRAVLEDYAEAGGSYREVVMDDAGHSPYLEDIETFLTHFNSWVSTHG